MSHQEVFNTLFKYGYYDIGSEGSLFLSDPQTEPVAVVKNAYSDSGTRFVEGQSIHPVYYMCCALKGGFAGGAISLVDMKQALAAIEDYMRELLTIDSGNKYLLENFHGGSWSLATCLTYALVFTDPIRAMPPNRIRRCCEHIFRNWDDRPRTRETVKILFNKYAK